MRTTSAPTAESDEKPEDGHHTSRPPVFALTIAGAVRCTGIGRSTLYTYIRSGALAAKKCGARTLILADDLGAFLRSLPSFPTANTPNKVVDGVEKTASSGPTSNTGATDKASCLVGLSEGEVGPAT